jgi:O-antigen/teichoic acid export membrane protein
LVDAAIIWTVVKRRHPQVHLQLSRFHVSVIKRIFSFSVFVLVLQVGNQLSFQTDSLVIGKRLQISMIPFYAVANSLTTYTIDFVTGIAAVVMTMAIRLRTENKADELQSVFLRWSKIAFSLAVLSTVCFMALGPPFIGRWMGPAFEGPSGTVLRILVFANLFFLPIRGVALPVLMGLGNASRPTMAFLAAGILNLILSLAWARPWGLAGVAWGTAIPNIAFAGAILLLVCLELKLPLRRYFGYVAVRAVLGGVPVAAFLYWVQRAFTMQSYTRLGLAAISTAFVFGVVWVAFVLRGDPHIDVQSRLNLLWPWRARAAS